MARVVFDPDNQALFGAHYPLQAMRFGHSLTARDLFDLDALSLLSQSLPAANVERRFADNQPDSPFRKIAGHDLTVAEHIRAIANHPAWIMLAHIDTHPDYRDAIDDIIHPLAPLIEAATGPMRHLTAFIFISSAGAVTPAHFDPEYNLFFQLSGAKKFTVALPQSAALDAARHEALHVGGDNMLPLWGNETTATCHDLDAGDGLFVPYKAPHWIAVGAGVSISLSITWKSDWCLDQEYAHRFNARLRTLGLAPAPLPSWPKGAAAKALGARIFDRFGWLS